MTWGPVDSDTVEGRYQNRAVVDVYDAARYGNYIYEGSPQPALNAADEAWASQLVAATVR